MKTLLKTEELGLLLLGIALFWQLPFVWWWFPALLLAPDIGMLGYLFGNRVGAISYNLFHHRGIAVLCLLVGYTIEWPVLELVGVILFSHIALDRMFGYGLKYKKGFAHTHLGEL